MIEPTGYTALDLIGFTDRGAYDPTANYVTNDIVTVGNTKWRCKVDDTTGVTPAENANWTIYLESATSLAGMDDVDISTPSDGDLLQFNGADNEWVNTHDEISAIENVYGSKNLHRLTKVYVGNTGITWSMDENGVITLNGTASGNWTLFMTADASNWSYSDGTVGLLRKGTYKLVNKGANNKNDNTCFMGLVVKKSDGTSAADIDTSSGVDVTNDFTIDGDNYSYISYIRVSNGTTVTNVKFYPMIVDSRVKDLIYTPYAPTNRDCMSYAVNTKLGAHNFLKNTAMTQTINSITFTVNDDGSVTANGTASANTNLLLMGWTNKAFPEGQFVVSDDIADHTGAYVYVDARKGSGSVSTIANTKNHPDFNINYATYDTFYVAIWVVSGTVLSNVTFKPMIRLASDTDPTYAPYAMTNMELTEHEAITTGTTGLITLVTNGNNISNNNSRVEKYGKLCIVTIAVKFSADTSDYVKIGTVANLPRYQELGVQSSGSVVSTSLIETNGDVKVYSPRSGWTYSQISYIAQ